MDEIESDTDDNIPAKRGKKWTDAEDEQMLKLIKQKKSYEDISEILERTPNGVKYHLEKMVYDSYMNSNKDNKENKENKETLDDISVWSGLTRAQIDYVIAVHTNKAARAKHKEKTHNDLNDLSELKQIVSMLNDIQTKVNKLMEKYEVDHRVQVNNNVEKTKLKSDFQIVVVKPPINQVKATEKPITKKVIIKGK